jgi:dTDP-4-dehydrorhamnose reductase
MVNKIIIFGSNGMLGRYITKYFMEKNNTEVISLTRKDFEINPENITKLDNFLKKYNINENTCIINCNGLIPQRAINFDKSNYFIINSIFPLHLSKVCQKYNSKLICPTTDCVYSGIKGNYIETDIHDETNEYGISKSLGEPIDATVIRTSIIGEELENKKSFLEFVKNSTGTINGWTNHYWNGITCLQYCKIIDKIIKDNLFWKGLRHIYSPERKSKYELACIIKDVYKLDIDIIKSNTNNTIDKTLYSIYNISTTFNIPSLEQQISEQYIYLKDNN